VRALEGVSLFVSEIPARPGKTLGDRFWQAPGMDDQPLTRTEAEALLRYAEATYRATTAWRRRLAAAAAVFAVLFGLLFLVSAAQWWITSASIDDVVDAPLVEALGVEVPDPRPALERAQLRIRALLWGLAACGTGSALLVFGGAYFVVRPPPEIVPTASGQPPM
jgi:hypothetical protein